MRSQLKLSVLVTLPVLALLGGASALQADTAPPLSTPEQLVEYLVQHPGDFALVSYTAGADGTPDPADPMLVHAAAEPMPLASTFKIVVLAAYAREVAAGRLDPAARVRVADWERYYLPLSDGGAHPDALEELGLASNLFGFAKDPEATVTLDALARAMIKWSDNAATDLLMDRLGDGPLRAVIAEAGLTGQDVPRSILGTFLSWDNHQQGRLTPARLRRLESMDEGRYADLTERLEASYRTKSGWRRAEQLWRLFGGANEDVALESRAAHATFTHGTAGDYARIMAGVLTGTFLSPNASALMRRHLEWPLEIPEITHLFETLGTKGGSLRAGVLTGATYAVPREGPYAGRRRVTVLFLRHLPTWAFDALRQSGADQLLTLRLALDPEFESLVEEALVD